MHLVGIANVAAAPLKWLVQVATGIALYLGVNLLMRTTVLFEAVHLVRQVLRTQTVP